MKSRFPLDGVPFDRRKLLGAAGSTAAPAALGGVTTRAYAAAVEAMAVGAAQLSPPILETPPAAGNWIELSRSAVVANVEAIRRAAAGRPIMGVVKANAYGHGLVPMARELTRAGVESLMVITVDEALAIRDAGIDVPVLNYGPFDSAAADELVRRGIDQAVYTVAAVEQMVESGRRVDRSPRLQVIFDTGLGRVGAPERQAAGLFPEVARLRGGSDMTITGVATALTEDPEYDRVQLGRYNRLCEAASNGGVEVGTRHVASSAAVLDFPESHLDMVRPGIMLYGHYPNDRSMRERPIELTPVLSLKAKVAYVKTLQRGDSVGYHRA